jgi:hypothetical protein
MKKILILLTLAGSHSVLHAREFYINTNQETGVRYSFLNESVQPIDDDRANFIISAEDPKTHEKHRWPASIDGCKKGGGRLISKFSGKNDVLYWTWQEKFQEGAIMDQMAQMVCLLNAAYGAMKK